MPKDIYDPAKTFNEKIRELIKSTHPTEGPIIVSPFGKRFKIDRNYEYWKDFTELTGTDGIGTKAIIHWEMGTFANAAQDAFAMVVDDLIEGGFVPVTLQNHIQMKEDPPKVLALIRGLVKLCEDNKWKYASGKYNPIIISGGETAQIDTIKGFEMGVTATGYCRKEDEVYPDAQDGDVLVGLGSSGVHSNGLSFYRNELFANRKMTVESELPWNTTVGKELTIPTNVYLPAIKALIELFHEQEGVRANSMIHGMVHITGGGLSKLKELSPKKTVDFEVSRGGKLGPQEIFRYAHDELGMPSHDMYRRFNNGIGFVITIDPSASKKALASLRKYFKAEEIGIVKKGSGSVSIESEYDKATLEYK